MNTITKLLPIKCDIQKKTIKYVLIIKYLHV